MELKEAVRQDGHDWIRDDVVVRMEAELLAEIVLLRKIAQAVWSNRNQLANRYLGPGAAQRMPDEIDSWLEEWFMVREKNAPTFQALAPDSPAFDPELELLNRLGRLFPDDLHKLMSDGWTNLSHGYVDHPDTLGSTRGAQPGQTGFSWPGQSALGFLNQSRRVRGLPRIVMVEEKTAPPTAPNVKWAVRFEPWTGPGDPTTGRAG